MINNSPSESIIFMKSKQSMTLHIKATERKYRLANLGITFMTILFLPYLEKTERKHTTTSGFWEINGEKMRASSTSHIFEIKPFTRKFR